MRPVGHPAIEEDIKKEEDKNMSFANRHNTTASKFTFNQEKDVPYFKLKDLYKNGYKSAEKTATVRGAYINRGGKYGDSAALVCDGFNVNLPSHMLKEIEEILGNDEDIQDINAGAVGFYVYEYTNRNGGLSYGLRWADLEVLPF